MTPSSSRRDSARLDPFPRTSAQSESVRETRSRSQSARTRTDEDENGDSGDEDGWNEGSERDKSSPEDTSSAPQKDELEDKQREERALNERNRAFALELARTKVFEHEQGHDQQAGYVSPESRGRAHFEAIVGENIKKREEAATAESQSLQVLPVLGPSETYAEDANSLQQIERSRLGVADGQADHTGLPGKPKSNSGATQAAGSPPKAPPGTKKRKEGPNKDENSHQGSKDGGEREQKRRHVEEDKQGNGEDDQPALEDISSNPGVRMKTKLRPTEPNGIYRIGKTDNPRFLNYDENVDPDDQTIRFPAFVPVKDTRYRHRLIAGQSDLDEWHATQRGAMTKQPAEIKTRPDVFRLAADVQWLLTHRLFVEGVFDAVEEMDMAEQTFIRQVRTARDAYEGVLRRRGLYSELNGEKDEVQEATPEGEAGTGGNDAPEDDIVTDRAEVSKRQEIQGREESSDGEESDVVWSTRGGGSNKGTVHVRGRGNTKGRRGARRGGRATR